MKNTYMVYIFVLIMHIAAGISGAEKINTKSVHSIQVNEMNERESMISEDAIEARDLEKKGLLFPLKNKMREDKNYERTATSPAISDDFIVFGYAQSEGQIYHTRWNALTHIASRFVYFDSNGNFKSTSVFTGRSSYLKAGGAADAAGVKIILVVTSFSDGADGDIAKVMTNPVPRANLVNNIKNLLESDSYVHGVTLDLEFSWPSNVRDGITAFFKELRAALPVKYETSIYTNPTMYSSQWNFDAVTGITPHINYMLYSSYTFASGNTPHAISDFNTALPKMRAYLEDGLPPEKLIVVLAAYAQYWAGTNTYNVAGTSKVARGFTDTMYDTTFNPNNGGPHYNNYIRGDEVGWYTWNDGADRVATWDNPEALEYEIRHVLSFQDSTGMWNGRRLRGVGFWSLLWMAETSSYDMIEKESVSRTRTYPHIYQLCEEILSKPGDKRYLIEGFEGLDYRWRDPDESPDTKGDTDKDSSRTIVSSPSGGGRPESSTNAMRVNFDLEGSGANTIFFRHEILASNYARTIPDTNATAAHFDSTTELYSYIYTPASYSGYNIRMAILDSKGELEVSDPYSLNSSGWREISWDITNQATVNGRSTSEPAFKNGDGIIDTGGDGKKDISFIGFYIEGNGAKNGSVYLDEISFEHRNPDGKDYVINEFRYRDNDSEFIEIYGISGTFPPGLEVRFYSSEDATFTSIKLEGKNIPNDKNGYGFFVIGDPGVDNIDYSTGFNASSDDISNNQPSSIQIYNPATGCVYDSLVYQTFGGLGDLIRKQTHGVCGEGYPWIGQIANGTDSQGTDYVMARYPDGNDTDMNFKDFSFMNASPGVSNGNKISPGSTFNFTTTPEGVFQTFQAFSVSLPSASGLPNSPNGGNAHRCIDTTGGGVISIIGDAALGFGGSGYQVSGEIYIPSGTDAAGAIAIGFCGSQGTNFYSKTAVDGAAYETGYWIVYENASGIGLNNGRPDHAGSFEFQYATNDNMDGNPVTMLDSATRSETGAIEGSWTNFFLSIDPNAEEQEQLTAKINNFTIYQGAIPEGAPISGAVQVAFRENHTGAPTSKEGCWIDNLSIRSVNQVDIFHGWEMY
jgi:glycosyl hydrolase family 18 (putative chitinase)